MDRTQHTAVASAEFVTDVIKHYGVKGMKWGVRKKSPRPPGPDASEDAKKAFSAKEKVSKTGGTEKLSNSELRALVDRMNLERQYSTLDVQTRKKNPAAKFVADVLTSAAKQQVTKLASDQMAKQVARALR